jgi:hypothetical protein
MKAAFQKRRESGGDRADACNAQFSGAGTRYHIMEEIMKRNSAVTTIMILVLTSCLSFASDHDGSGGCSTRRTAGDWGFTSTGVLTPPTGPPVPTGAVGKFTQDSAGNVQGSQVRSTNGVAAHQPFTGTVAVNADCTAKYTLNVYDDSGNLLRTVTLDAVVVDNGNLQRWIVELSLLPDGTSVPQVQTVEANRL